MATIEAKRLWNRTDLKVEKGREYRFSAKRTWFDATIESSAGGKSYPKLDWLSWMKRMPSAKWFSVIGAIDKRRDTLVDIGRLIEEGATYTAPASGTLYCFANDVCFMYWNNDKSIELEMKEVG